MCGRAGRGLVRAVCAARGWALTGVGEPGPALLPERARAVAAVVAARGAFQPRLLEGVTGSGKTEVYLEAIRACLARGQQALVLVPEIGLTPQALQRFRRRLGVPVLAFHSGLSRSEEHTSELQSLMRISYAVFCLKKKNTNYTQFSELHYAADTT